MAGSINGIGTTYYGQSDFEADGSFVITKWFIVGFVPLLPMGSSRVRFAEERGILGINSTYEVLRELPLHWVQVLKTWAYVALFVGLLIATFGNPMKPASVFQIVLLCALVLLPHGLRWFAKRSGNR